MPSLQFSAGPPTQVPPLHVSAVVQALPSLQDAVLFVLTQPVDGLHESFVQTLPSLQLGAGPPTQVPPAQVSAVVQAFPSLHDAVLFAWTQPVAGLHESSVQTLLSLQFERRAADADAAARRRRPSCRRCRRCRTPCCSRGRSPVAGLHESSVQTLPSLQFERRAADAGAAARTCRPWCTRCRRCTDAVLFVWTQPVDGLHESFVQTLPSLQFSAGPPTQVPPLHVSAVVQALPSLQDAVLFVLTQPVAGLHESSVQTLPSLQFGAGPPTQVPPAQVSAVVQALPSLQDAVLFAWTQPVAGLHESFVQTLPSLQFGRRAADAEAAGARVRRSCTRCRRCTAPCCSC